MSYYRMLHGWASSTMRRKASAIHPLTTMAAHSTGPQRERLVETTEGMQIPARVASWVWRLEVDYYSNSLHLWFSLISIQYWVLTLYGYHSWKAIDCTVMMNCLIAVYCVYGINVVSYIFFFICWKCGRSFLSNVARDICFTSIHHIAWYLYKTQFPLSPQVVHDYSLEVARTFPDIPTMSLYFSCSLSHDYLNMVQHADIPHFSYLLELYKMGALNYTAVIFLSDHGIRFGSIRSTYIGMLEERLPYLLIYLPPWFREKWVMDNRGTGGIDTLRWKRRWMEDQVV